MYLGSLILKNDESSFVLREVMRRDEEACELRSDILRKNALIADLTLMNERLSVGKEGSLPTSGDNQEGQRSSLPISDGALELELAQTKVSRSPEKLMLRIRYTVYEFGILILKFDSSKS